MKTKVVLALLAAALPFVLLGAREETKADGPQRAIAVIHSFGKGHIEGVLQSQPAGDAGARIACGVVGVANPKPPAPK
jgi:Cu/Zn superoxide dismutase